MDERSVGRWDNEMMITLKGIIDEDFVNYEIPSMTLMFPHCSFKCDTPKGRFCHNSDLATAKDIKLDVNDICRRYIKNPITKSIVCQGLEPFDSFVDLYSFISALRKDYDCLDTVVIYTGYEKEEIKFAVNELSKFKNIIIKFGRFIPDSEKRFDNVLGVYLASKNQYAEKIS